MEIPGWPQCGAWGEGSITPALQARVRWGSWCGLETQPIRSELQRADGGYFKNESTFCPVTSFYTWFSLFFSLVKTGSCIGKRPTAKHRPFGAEVARGWAGLSLLLSRGRPPGLGGLLGAHFLPLCITWMFYQQISYHLKCFFNIIKTKGGAKCNISGKQYRPRILSVQLGLVILLLEVQQRN